MKVVDLSASLPVAFVSSLPAVCPICKRGLEVNEALLGGLRCPLFSCAFNSCVLLSRFFKLLGFSDIPFISCLQIAVAYNLVLPTQLFELALGDRGFTGTFPSLSWERSSEIIASLKSRRKQTVWDYVRYSCIPNITEACRGVFDTSEITGLRSLYEFLDKEGVDYICRNLADVDVTCVALKIYDNLMLYRAALQLGASSIDWVLPKVNICYCLDGHVKWGGFSNATFREYVEQEWGLRFSFTYSPSLTRKVDYLISSVSSSCKRTLAMARGVEIVTEQLFFECLKSRFDSLSKVHA